MARSVESSSNSDALVSLSGSAIISIVYRATDVVTTAENQTIAGSKTFSSTITTQGNVVVGNGAAASIRHADQDQSINYAGGNSGNDGGNITMYGSTHSNTGDIRFRHSTTEYGRLDASNSRWDWADSIFYNLSSIYVTERAAAQADIAGFGQFWTLNSAPNVPMFTDDAGTDGTLGRLEFAQTWTGLQTFDDAIKLGTGAQGTLTHTDADQSLRISGGSSTTTGANIQLNGPSHATANEFVVRIGTADLIRYDHSELQIEINEKFNMLDNTIQRANLLDYGKITNAIGGTGGGTQDIDLTLGNSVSATVDTSANTFTFSNPTASDEMCSFTLVLTNGGSQTVNWPAAVDWAGGTAPTLTSSGVDVLEFMTVDGGTTWYGFAAGLDMQ